MPLGSPIGSNRGIQTRDQIRIIIEQAVVPVVVDAGLGAPSHASEAMEMGADAVLVNTAIAVASDPNRMATAFRMAVEAGRAAFEAGLAARTGHREPDQPVDGVPGLTRPMGTKQNWIMPLVAALVVACVGWWADRQLRQVMQEELTDDLRTMLGADVTALEIWMANQKRIAAMLAEEPRLRNLAVELLSKGGARSHEPNGVRGPGPAVDRRRPAAGAVEQPWLHGGAVGQHQL